MMIGSGLIPDVVLGSTVAEKEKVLSPATASPCVPSSYNVCGAAPPIKLRLEMTVIPVLVGPVPGVTTTLSKVVTPGATTAGDAEAIPDGLVDACVTVRPMFAEPERNSASVMLAGRDLSPGVVAMSTVAEKEKVLSPPVTSPL